MEDKFTKTIIVKADVNKVYNAWSNFENFPYFMKNIKSVEKTGVKTSHWEMKGPLGVTVEWDAETTENDPDKRIGWSTKDRKDGDLTTSGQVTFTQLPDSHTQITATVHYVTKAGLPGEVAARLFSDPEKQLEEDLVNFKQYIEGALTRTP